MTTFIEPEPDRRHRCDQPTDRGKTTVRNPWPGSKGPEHITIPKRVEHGSLWQCPTCRRWWVAGPHPMHGRGVYYAGGGLVWNRVHWWNWGLRRRIRVSESGHS